MRSAGIDIGSSAIKAIMLDNGIVCRREVVEATSRPLEIARRLVAEFACDAMLATGYGRHLLELDGMGTVTEIKACARGMAHLRPGVGLVVDIGGQDVKAISCDSKGRAAKFEMNDRCAAGTGKFLDMMARKLEYSRDSFGDAALRGSGTIAINALCAVFAESEVIGLLNRNCPREDIARAVHTSVVQKVLALCKRLDTGTKLVALAGGAAMNKAIVAFLEQELRVPVWVPENPQTVTALGAALLVADRR